LCVSLFSNASEPVPQGVTEAVRVERWLASVEKHEPGKADEAARGIAEWTNAELLTTINALKRTSLANDVLKRGAVLHLDIALLFRGRATGPLFRSPRGDPPLTFTVLDGRAIGLASTSARPQLEFARALLDEVKPAPASDMEVRLWYIATALALAREYELAEAVIHLRIARGLFPDDADLLVASGCVYEVFAAPRFQTVVRGVAGRGQIPAVGSERQNLVAAEKMFRQALKLHPELGEARLRLGRMLGLLGRHKEAIAELQRVVAAKLDPMASYYALLFLGREEEVLGRAESARGYFERAAKLFPNAQSPYLALSRLAFHDGDTRRAERAVQQVMALSTEEQERFDPWWLYFAGQGRYAESLLTRLYQVARTVPR
jgi:hypothetical protein